MAGEGENTIPVPESVDAFDQVATGIVRRVDEHAHVDLGQLLGDELAEMLGEGIVGSKRLLIPLLIVRHGCLVLGPIQHTLKPWIKQSNNVFLILWPH